MSWKTLNRVDAVVDSDAPAVLSEAVREKIRSFFPRYPTKRAALLPALHVVQDALGHVDWKAMVEIAGVLDLHPSDVFDTISFYTHFWTKPKGEKVVTVCRSVSCELMGGADVLEAAIRKLGVGEHETTPDGKYSLTVEECLAACDHAPCLLINERLHKGVLPEAVSGLLDAADNDALSHPRSDLYDAPADAGGDAA